MGENIKMQRRRVRLSLEEVAQKLKVSAQTVSGWESGREEPTVANLMALARLFQISYDRLVESGKEKGEYII